MKNNSEIVVPTNILLLTKRPLSSKNMFTFRLLSSHIIFTTLVNLENACYLYSACSNPTDCVSDYAPINFGGPNIQPFAYFHTQDNH
jgi:hypothetical protein